MEETFTDEEVAYLQAVATTEARADVQEGLAEPPYKLSLLSANCTSNNVGFTRCEGFVRNISGAPLRNVVVVIEWVDDNEVPQAADQAPVTYNPILPEQESPWSTIAAYNPSFQRFRVVFREFAGGTIVTRDDRAP